MLILGWDIGIKNLSYCLVEYTGDSKQPIEEVYSECKIKSWGIIDLLNADEPTDNVSSNILNALETNAIAKKTVAKKPAEKKPAAKKKPKKCKDLKLIEIGRTIKKKFDEISEFNSIDYVVIENQPVLKNPTMKSIQIMVFSYFVYKDQPQNHEITDVCLLNANNKMKVYKGEIDPEVLAKITKLKSKYSQNKKLSIIHTNLMLENINEESDYIEMFNKSKKKDDLADSYLMSLFFISNRINTPIKIKKIQKKKKPLSAPSIK
jgi:hypothetical protein